MYRMREGFLEYDKRNGRYFLKELNQNYRDKEYKIWHGKHSVSSGQQLRRHRRDQGTEDEK